MLGEQNTRAGSKMQFYQGRQRSGGGSKLSVALARMQRQTDTGLVPFQLGGAPILADAIETDDSIIVDAFVVVRTRKFASAV